jgi:hypothetical protein
VKLGSATVPVPVNVAVFSPADVCTEKFWLNVVAAVGVNTTSYVQESPAASDAPQLEELAKVNGEAMLGALSVSGWFPVLLTVRAIAAEA